ncbi:MAG: TonB-dependent receptor [Gammaproteobacteria bacterium]|nr:TonB-dependent receptor [Gammaproteobacteria bacterium]MBU2059594.1 TonB-dependent receptor [Gammaproteobacteria bacterium]MBU2175754.1 TonB-dependent receptor [Gammaproteobacteria bacterium]MBU2248066.1 TonB-dependent receptor [Gammaproteobacteria bacterium]MBU2345987.1 TonB-dependent receptor [Gammaproteobacteria bacterium]
MAYSTQKQFKKKMLSSLILASLASGAFTVMAAEGDEAAIERITVTTQKRVQAIQDVPVTVTAFSGEMLEQLGIADLDLLSEITPGLVIQEQSPNNPGFVIRGITSDSGSAQSSPRVSVYYNGADVSRSRGSYFELFDIERVEVVKGPQATLFGTAASVGALSVTTRKPQEEFEAAVTLGAGNFSAKNMHGYVTGGEQKVQGRLAFTYKERDGYVENIAQNQPDLHGIERTGIRPSLRITPNDDLTLDLVYNFEKNNDTGTAFKSRRFAPTGGDTSPYSFVEASGSPLAQQVFGKPDLGVERTVKDLNLTVNWDLNEHWQLTSISAKRSFDSLEVFDADGTQAWFLEFAEDATGDQFSQELRFNYSGEKLNSFFGISYFDEDGSQLVPFSTEESIYLNCVGQLAALNLPCINPDGTVNILTPLLTEGQAQLLPYQGSYQNFGENKAFSVFADFSYAVTEALELTAGLRYVDEDKTSGYASNFANSVLAKAPLLPVVSTNGEIFSAEGSFDAWLPRFNALYRLNEQLNFYATISKGRRSEVVDVNSASSPTGAIPRVTELPAETIWNYEAGIKGSTENNSLRYAVSMFYQDYQNFQVTLQDDAGNFYTDNAGNAKNIGIEAELSTSLSDDLEWFTNLAWIDAKIDDDSSNGNLAGNRFRLQPEYTVGTGLLHSYELGGEYQLNSSLLYSFRSDIFFEEANAPVAGFDITQGAVQLTSLRFGLENTQQNWSVTLYSSNLFDKEYLVDAGNTGGAFGYPSFVPAAPRLFGIEFSKSFM